MRRLTLSFGRVRARISAFAAETRRILETNLAQIASWRASFSARSCASTNENHDRNAQPVKPCNN